MKYPMLHTMLMQYDFDQGYQPQAGHTFIDKLIANNLEWTREMAEQAILEYKRFIYLAIVHGKVAPSDAVDQVWHQHILYTVDYERFCNYFGAQFIHHSPDRYESSSIHAYTQTMKNYYREFGHDAPAHIWSLKPNAPMRVNLYNNYVIPTGSLASVVKLFFHELKTKFVW